MRKLAFLLFTLVLAAGMAVAQDQGTAQDPAAQQQQAQPDQTTPPPTDTTTNTANQPATDTQGTANQGEKLPQTASPLPLLGLLGLGSVVAGVAARKRK